MTMVMARQIPITIHSNGISSTLSGRGHSLHLSPCTTSLWQLGHSSLSVVISLFSRRDTCQSSYLAVLIIALIKNRVKWHGFLLKSYIFLSNVPKAPDFQIHQPAMRSTNGKKNESVSKLLVNPVETVVAPNTPLLVT